MKRLWVALLSAILVLSAWGGTNWTKTSAAPVSANKFGKCTAKGKVTFMFWGDKIDQAAQLASAKRIPQYVTQGALLPLDSFVKKDNLKVGKIFWGQCVREMTYKGKLYGLPRTCGNQSLLFDNKEM